MKQYLRKKRLYIGFAAAVLLCLCAGAAGLWALDRYCAKIFPDEPYRRYIAYYFRERVLKGLVLAPVENVFLTEKENLSSTKLPVWEIRLSGSKLAALSNNLPASGRVAQSGRLIVGNETMPARFRFRGDHFWHWKSKQKSWKIKLRGEKRYNGIREFNLVNPRDPTALQWPLAAYLARQMGLRTPTLQHVHARLNGRYLGVLFLLENFDHTFTAHHGLPRGALYADEAFGPVGHNSWMEKDAWYIRPPEVEQKHQAGMHPEETFERRLNLLIENLAAENDQACLRDLEKLIDIDQYLRWWAHAVICLDIHQDRHHNNRLYLDPTSAKFVQIPWDIEVQAYRDPCGDIDLNLNPITERLLQSPAQVHARNRVLWDAIQGPASIKAIRQWIDASVNLFREDMYCDPHKDALLVLYRPLASILRQRWVLGQYIQPVTNRSFENQVRRIREFLAQRIACIADTLARTDARLFLYTRPVRDAVLPDGFRPAAQVVLEVDGQEGVMLHTLEVRFDGGPLDATQARLVYDRGGQLVERIAESAASGTAAERTVLRFSLHEHFLPGRMKHPPFGPAPARFTLNLGLPEGGLPASVAVSAEARGVHPLTGKKIVLKAVAAVGPPAQTPPPGKILFVAPGREITWQGDMRIEEDRVIAQDEVLVVLPGTRILLAQGASIVAYGRIRAVGTSGRPIVFTRVRGSDAWGVVALQGAHANGSVFEHCVFEYGKQDNVNGVFYSGALSIYNADASVRNCVFRFNRGDDALNTKFSQSDILDSTFSDNLADGCDLDFSSGRVVMNTFTDNGNDGIDCGTANPLIRNNRIYRCGDKGISIGERSRPVVEDNHIEGCSTGIAVKDQSVPEIRDNRFVSNTTAVMAYRKKKVFGGSHVTVHAGRFENNRRLFATDKMSSVEFEP